MHGLTHLAPIRTKLNPPQYLQAAMVRPRLSALNPSLAQRKILSVVAPPGYGKSTYLTQLRQEFLQSKNKHKTLVPWLNLDSDDNDPITMTRYLCASFNQYNTEVAERSLQILNSGSLRSLKELYVALIEDIENSKQSWLLFVDDFHVLEKGESLKLWQYFIDHLPDNLTLAIASRKALPLKLKRLQLNEELCLVHAKTLQFDATETRHFFLDYRHQKLSEDLLKLVQDKTEGWAGALQMLSLSLRQASDVQALVQHFSGEHKDIMEYLSEVVLEQLAPELKSFMLNISVLDRVCASVATKLSEDLQAQNKLEELEQRNLFLIPLDNEKRWYRFHHLFQDFLRRQALKLLGEKGFQEKYRQASLWFEQEGYHHEAIQYALTGKDYQRAAELLSGFAMLLFQNQGDHRSMQHWMKQLPERYVTLFPMIRISYSISLTFTNHFKESHAELEKLKAQIHNIPPEIANDLISMIEMNEVMIASFQDKIMLSRQLSTDWLQKYSKATAATHGFALNIRGVSLFFTSSFQQGLEDLQKAAALHKANQVYYAYVWALCGSVGIHWTHGKLNKAFELYQELILIIKKLHGEDFHLDKLMQVAISDLYYEKADFEKALALIINNKIYICSFSGTDDNIIYYYVLIRIRILAQQFSQASEYLKEGEKWAKELEYQRFQDQMFLLKIELYLQTRRVPEARQLLESCNWSKPAELTDEIEDTNIMIRNIFERFALSRVLMAEKKFTPASQRLKSLIILLEKIGLMRHLLSARIIEALCEANLKSHENALQKLQQTLELAAPEGFVSVFLEHGAELNHQLYILLKQIDGLSMEAIKLRNKILRQLELYFEQSQKDKTQGIQLLDKISSRELEILNALDSVKNNTQVAKSLHISLGTLKWHLHNIYQKLDVKNRSGAVLKAKQLELI